MTSVIFSDTCPWNHTSTACNQMESELVNIHRSILSILPRLLVLQRTSFRIPGRRAYDRNQEIKSSDHHTAPSKACSIATFKLEKLIEVENLYWQRHRRRDWIQSQTSMKNMEVTLKYRKLPKPVWRSSQLISRVELFSPQTDKTPSNKMSHIQRSKIRSLAPLAQKIKMK